MCGGDLGLHACLPVRARMLACTDNQQHNHTDEHDDNGADNQSHTCGRLTDGSVLRLYSVNCLELA
jgi:hypothetical protein